MLTELAFPYPGSVYGSPMPFGPFDRVGQIWSNFQEQGVDVVVILTEQAEYLTYAGRDLVSFYRSHGIDVVHLPVPDHHTPPDMEAYREGLRDVARRAREGQDIAVHCLAGIGRTGTFLACLAVKEMEMKGQEAIQWVRDHIPGALENERQERFVIHYSYEVETC